MDMFTYCRDVCLIGNIHARKWMWPVSWHTLKEVMKYGGKKSQNSPSLTRTENKYSAPKQILYQDGGEPVWCTSRCYYQEMCSSMHIVHRINMFHACSISSPSPCYKPLTHNMGAGSKIPEHSNMLKKWNYEIQLHYVNGQWLMLQSTFKTKAFVKLLWVLHITDMKNIVTETTVSNGFALATLRLVHTKLNGQ